MVQAGVGNIGRPSRRSRGMSCRVRLWARMRCVLRFQLSAKARGQLEQRYGSSPVWVRWCRAWKVANPLSMERPTCLEVINDKTSRSSSFVLSRESRRSLTVSNTEEHCSASITHIIYHVAQQLYWQYCRKPYTVLLAQYCLAEYKNW